MQYTFGIHAVDGLLRSQPQSVQRLWLQQGREDKRFVALLELARNQGVTVARAPRADLDTMVDGRHQGVVAETVERSEQGELSQSNLWSEKDLLQHVEEAPEPVLILVLDGVTDPHNLGACLRSADAAGVDAVVVPKDKAADLGPTVRKVASGAAETVPVRGGQQAFGSWPWHSSSRRPSHSFQNARRLFSSTLCLLQRP